MTDTWRYVDIHYSPEHDGIELIDLDGEVLGVIHRNTVIRMLAMLPAEPPEKDDEHA